ncbi:MAG: hypothetical protein ACJ75H_02935 [Thermoanaerobaculia bacterium]
MKRGIVLCLALTGLLLLAPKAAHCEIGTIDDVPGATLLLPYFELDLASAEGITTLFSINNASATAVLAHVTLWTDMSIPTLDFDVYLTGYDVQTINLRDIFNGVLPVTASAGQDPKDTISPHGPVSQDINFASCATFFPFSNPALNSTLLNHIRAAHTGKASTVFSGRCSGANYGDNVARGYITVDTVSSCNLLFPNSVGYFTGVATTQNVLWGDYFYVNQAENFAQGETLVHVEACSAPSVGNGAGNCPFTAGDYTFYGRYVGGAGTDQREPLATTFASRYITGGGFDGGTDLIVWRDSKTTPTGANGPFSCAAGGPSWFPLNQADVVAFDESEHATDLCVADGDNVSPPIGEEQTCFPLESQRVHIGTGNVIGNDPNPPYTFGWLFLNLNTTVASGIFNPTAQAWVTTTMDANGRFSVGYDAIQLDNALYTHAAGFGGNVILP